MSNQRTSPSFIFAVAVIVIAIVGYLGWRYVAPNASGNSEMIVRSLSAAIAAEMGPFRRSLREIEREARGSESAKRAAQQRIDDLAQDVIDKIVDLADQAATDVEMVAGIAMNTQENRLTRVRRLSLEGRARVGQLVAEAKLALATDAQGTEPQETGNE